MTSTVKRPAPADAVGIDFIEYKSNKYYNKFDYKIAFRATGIRFMRVKNTSYQQYRINIRKSLYKTAEHYEQFYDINRRIMQLLERISAQNPLVIIRREHDTVSVFTNDLATIRDQLTEVAADTISITVSQVHAAADNKKIFRVTESPHSYRVRFHGRASDEQLVTLVDFCRTYAEVIRPNSVLNQQINPRKRMLSYGRFLDYYTIDLSEQKLITLLRLSLGDLVRDVLEFEQITE